VLIAESDLNDVRVIDPPESGDFGRFADSIRVLCLLNYSDQTRVIDPSLASGTLHVLLDSSGSSQPGRSVTVYSTRPETFPTLAPFGVIVYRMEN